MTEPEGKVALLDVLLVILWWCF